MTINIFLNGAQLKNAQL